MQGLLRDIVICPACGETDCEWSEQTVTCPNCRSVYMLQDEIPQFLQKDGYWCNIPRRDMQDIVAYVRTRGFQAGLRDRIPQYLHQAILPTGRADARFFLPFDSGCNVLDLGCMWGALTFALAEHAGTVIGLDQTLETLQLSYYRAKEAAVQNVAFLSADALNMPLKDDTFDVVIMNGVLEWLGLDDQYVVEQQWGKLAKRERKVARSNSPRRLQLRGLQEALRVLKPGGTVCISIENRMRAAYFLGVPDDHSGLPFNSLLPRKLANIYSMVAIGQPYRTYTYTARGLRKLLLEAGFSREAFFTAFPTYEQPATIMPLDSKLLKFYLMDDIHRKKGYKRKLFQLATHVTGLSKALVPDFVVTARKASHPAYGVCDRTFCDTVADNWLALFPSTEKPSEIRLIKLRSRMEKGAPVSFLVFAGAGKARPLGFLKVNRDNSGFAALRAEADVYARIYAMSSESRTSLAEQSFFGQLGSSYVISRSFLPGRAVDHGIFQGIGATPGTSMTQRVCRGVFDRLVRVYADTPASAVSFAEFARSAIDWLITFNRDTGGPVVTFDAFWDVFVSSRLSSAQLKGSFGVSEELLEAYRVTLKELANGVELRTGAIHGDYNQYNILLSPRGVGIVDFEYAEENSFPPFDALNLFLQSACESGGVEQVEKLFSPAFQESELASTANKMLDLYAKSQGYSLRFVKGCAPLFVLDLLHRDYGFHEFSLRSAILFKRLVELVLDSRV